MFYPYESPSEIPGPIQGDVTPVMRLARVLPVQLSPFARLVPASGPGIR